MKMTVFLGVGPFALVGGLYVRCDVTFQNTAYMVTAVETSGSRARVGNDVFSSQTE
jgi:hypothetical protein